MMTDLGLLSRPAACAWWHSRSARESPPRASAPTDRKLRLLIPPHEEALRRPSQIVSTFPPRSSDRPCQASSRPSATRTATAAPPDPAGPGSPSGSQAELGREDQQGPRLHAANL